MRIAQLKKNKFVNRKFVYCIYFFIYNVFYIHSLLETESILWYVLEFDFLARMFYLF